MKDTLYMKFKEFRLACLRLRQAFLSELQIRSVRNLIIAWVIMVILIIVIFKPGR
jgi:hypothetical protein